jgi:glycosyltransferase involved in cell wall biosynthesis
VLCMPSFGEGFGIPLIEAQACGVPVITTDWTAMTELCGAGWLVDGERWYDATQGSFQKVPYVGEIVDALEASYKHGAGLAERARAFALDYDVDSVFEKYWLPVLDAVTAPREIAPLRLAA